MTLQAGPTAQHSRSCQMPTAWSVFLKLRSHPRLDAPGGDWRFVPLRELHTTDNKPMFDFDLAHPAGDLPVLTGASFNLWDPDFGEPYAYAKTSEVIPWLQERRRRQIRLTSSAFYGMPPEWAADPGTLPCLHPRIAFREVTRATDSRTVICALLPARAGRLFTRLPICSAGRGRGRRGIPAWRHVEHPAGLVRTPVCRTQPCLRPAQRVSDPAARSERSAVVCASSK